MYTTLMNYLTNLKNKKTITLSQLESQAPPSTNYSDFLQFVLSLEAEGFLSPIKAHGSSPIHSELSNTYRIQTNLIHRDLHSSIREKQHKFNSLIDLTPYFSLPLELWEHDQPWLDQLNDYLNNIGIPTSLAPAPERSYEIMKDEKWITEGDGKVFLERVGLYSQLLITPVPNPLMFSLNPKQVLATEHHHLIVENKTTYHALATVLIETEFTSLIYGSGKTFLTSILYLEKQLNLPDKPHHLYYFGDLDLEGIRIWHTLHKQRPALPAKIFYQALLDKPFYQGKTSHKVNTLALNTFCEHFSKEDQQKITSLFKHQGYYPQEALSTAELRTLWRNSWKQI